MKVTKTVYLHASDWGSQIVFGFDASSRDYILIATAEVTFEVPDDFDAKAVKVAVIDMQIDAAQREFAAKLQRLEDEKANMLRVEATA